VAERDGRAALRAVTGQPVIPARARLRFGPGRTCEPVARLLDRAIVQAEAAGLDPRLLVVADGRADAGEDIVRVRRKAHGVADWIHSPTCHVRITLRPAGLHATARPAGAPEPPESPELPGPPTAPVPAASASGEAEAVRQALTEVIDPDLGVNIVDLGFVRAVAVEGRTAVITMTLTSAACPLTGVLDDQIRAELGPLDGVDGFRVDWQWVPAWRPADITADGREQLRAIGFTI
jgi:metal-sulfur cluster biosynthetic enzyme